MPQRSFESLYEDYSRMVYWTAYGIVKSESDASDVTQDAFLRVIKHLHKLQGFNDAQLKSWLYRVSVNLCMDLKRKQKRETLTDTFDDTQSVSESELPEVVALSEEQQKEVRKAIDALPEIYRQTVTLHYFSGLEYEKIAELLGVSEGTVKSRMFRAKQKLLEWIKGDEAHVR